MALHLSLNQSVKYPIALFVLLAFIFLFNITEFIFEGLRYVQYSLTFFLLYILLLRIPRNGVNQKYFIFIFLYFILLIFRGLFRGNYLPYLFNDVYVWSFSVFILFFNSSSSLCVYKVKIPELFAKLLYFALPFTLIIFAWYGNLSTDITTRQLISGEVNEKAIYQPLLLAPLLMPFIIHFNRKLRFIVVASNLSLLIFGIFSATRSIVIVSLFGFIALFYIYKKNLSKILLLFSSIILLFYIGSLFISDERSAFFNDKFDYLLSRFGVEENITSGRDSELKGLFEKFTIEEFILGRGAGGSQAFGFWEEVGTVNNLGIPFTHFGFLNLILKGGYPLLFLVYGMALWSMVYLWKKHQREYSFVILIFLLSEISHTKFNDPFYMLFLWTSISYCLRLKTELKKKNILININR